MDWLGDLTPPPPAGMSFLHALCPDKPTPQTPPEILRKMANIEYVVRGSWKKYILGYTSFDATYDENRKRAISVVPFASTGDASRFFKDMDKLRGPNIVEAHFIHGSHVIIDRVRADFEDWLDYWHREFQKRLLPNAQWWSFIQDHFFSLFRDIFQSVRHLSNNGGYCGNIRECLAVDKVESSAKLASAIKTSPEDLRSRSLNDIMEIRSLAMEVILRPFGHEALVGSAEQQLQHYNKLQSFPEELLGWLTSVDRNARDTWNLSWLFDPACFWEASQKFSFIRKLHCWVYRLQDIFYYRSLDVDLGVSFALDGASWWDTLIPQSGPVWDVFNYSKNDQLRSKLEKGRNSIAFDSLFLGIIVLFKNLVGHYKEEWAVDDEYVIGVADGVFRGACMHLQVALGHFFFESDGPLYMSADAKPPDYYLTSQKF